MVIPVKRHQHLILGLAEQTQSRLGVGGSLHAIGLRCGQSFEFNPAQGSGDRCGLGHGEQGDSTPS